jgi:hypothetical protein
MKSAKSVKSVSLVAPDDQSITTIENSSVKEEPLKPIIKRSKSFKKTRFEDEIVCIKYSKSKNLDFFLNDRMMIQQRH